jgi:hypothetical protein
MIRKTLLAATIALATAGIAGPAAAQSPIFFEEYGDIFGARTFLGSSADARPKSALQDSESKVENPASRWLISPTYRRSDVGPGDVSLFGIGVGYASAGNPRHPWSVGVGYFNTDFDFGQFDFDVNTFDLGAKYVLWTPESNNLPVVSLIGRYQIVDEGVDDRIDILLAADQRLSDNLYLTGNLGYADQFDSDFQAGFGLTWRASRQLSLSANYVVDNDVNGEDFWSIAATWAASRDLAVRLGGGKHSTFFINGLWKIDR